MKLFFHSEHTFHQAMTMKFRFLLFALLLFSFSCHPPPGKDTSVSVVKKENSPASVDLSAAPQSINVIGIFLQGGEKADSLFRYYEFLVTKVVSLSSSLTHIAGTGETLRLRLGSNQKRYVEALAFDQGTIFQLILQEQLVPGYEGVIYSVKDITKIKGFE